MPKARQTCTRCSMRRQKCDKQQPCSRCIAAGEGHKCSRVWVGGYDASVHRQYPKADTKYRRKSSATESHKSRRNSDNDSTTHDHKHDATLQLPPLDSDSDGWSSEQDRRSVSGGCNEYDANFEDFLWSPDPLRRAMIMDRNTTVLPGIPYATQETDPRLRNHWLSEDTRKPNHLGSRFPHQEMSYLEDCLPNGLQILQLFEYHEQNLLWHTHCYHGPTTRREVALALQAGGGRICLKDHDLRWCALLFAVLTASLACASDSTVRKWGFTSEQRLAASKTWYEAAMECLTLGEYSPRPEPYFIQAILVLVGPSHVLGLSYRHSLMLGGALKMAQSLGFQRLPYSKGSRSPLPEDVALSREVGRRIWWSLVGQDWTSIASYDMFSIDPSQFTTPRPQSYDLEKANAPDRLAEIQNHMLDIATIMMEFHVASTACSDSASEYEQVWKHDQKLRELSRKDLCLEDLPLPWGFWAGQLLRMQLAHRIIDVHRNFFTRSFKDSAYSWSRWASIEAAKTILQEAQVAFDDPDRPVIWTDQTHLIAAGVTLGKDVSKGGDGPDREEHLNLIRKAMTLLARYDHSELAHRGHKLLSSFVKDASAAGSRLTSPDPTWSQIDSTASTFSGTSFRNQPPPNFNISRYSVTTTLAPSSLSLDPELAGPPFTTTAPGAFDLPSISVDPVPGEQSWVDMMPSFGQERLGLCQNPLGFEDPYGGF